MTERKCLTDGMVLSLDMNPGKITVEIEAFGQQWSKEMETILFERLHDGIEYALAPYWKEDVANGKA